MFGFHKGVSTEHAVALYNSILHSVDINDKVACIFFDQKRAFDVINIELLLSKIER